MSDPARQIIEALEQEPGAGVDQAQVDIERERVVEAIWAALREKVPEAEVRALYMYGEGVDAVYSTEGDFPFIVKVQSLSRHDRR